MWIETKDKKLSLFNLETRDRIEIETDAGSKYYILWFKYATRFRPDEILWRGSEAECQAEYDRLKAMLIKEKLEDDVPVTLEELYKVEDENCFKKQGTEYCKNMTGHCRECRNSTILQHFNITRKK